MRARMPDDHRTAADGADAPVEATVARAVRALQVAVPVRPEWRARLLETAAHATPPARGHTLVLSWPFAAAAAIVVFAAGAVSSRALDRSSVARRATATVPATSARAAGTHFIFVAPNAKRVALVGDFNLWDPARAPMHRIAGTDAWEVDLALPPGRHAYAFVVDGDVTADPSAPRTAGDDFGRPSSVVLVSSNRS
jgi:hypothetical protein